MALVPTIPTAIHLGATTVDRVYQGGNQVWPEPSLEVSFVARSDRIAGSMTSYTWTDAPLGNPDPTRRVVVVMQGTYSGVGYAATIGGVTATHETAGQPWNPETSAILSANVPTGTTGDITITNGNDWLNAWVAIYRLAGKPSTPQGGYRAGVTYPLSLDVPTVAGGVIIAAYGQQNSTGAGNRFTWDPLVENYDAGGGVNAGLRSGAMASGTDGSTVTLQPVCTITGQRHVLTAAVYG